MLKDVEKRRCNPVRYREEAMTECPHEFIDWGRILTAWVAISPVAAIGGLVLWWSYPR